MWAHEVQIQTAAALLALGDPNDAPEAERLTRDCLHERERRFGDRDPRVLTARVTLGRAIAAQLTHALNTAGPPTDPEPLAAALARFHEAESLIVPNFQSQVDALKKIPAPLRRLRIEGPAESLVNLYESWATLQPGLGKAEAAATWRARLTEVRALITESLGQPLK